MGFVCSHCGQHHEGLSARVYSRPDYWLGLTDQQRAAGKCDDDLCRTSDGHFFVRAVLILPLVEGPEATFEFGVWGSLSEENFYRYVETYDDGDQSKLGSMFSFISNEVRGFAGSLNLFANLVPNNLNERPHLVLQPSEHPLSIAQRQGIHFDKVLEIIHP